MPIRRHRDHRSGPPTILSRWRTRIDSEIHKVSDYLKEKSSRVSRKKLRRLFIGVVACWGAACIVIILDSILSRRIAERTEKLVHPELIRSGPTRDRDPTQVCRRVAQFQSYLDSLREYDPDRYLRMLITNPGQLDSLHRAEDGLSRLNL